MEKSNFKFVRYTIGLPGVHSALKFQTMISFMVEKCEETGERKVSATDGETAGIIESIKPLLISEKIWETREEFCSSDDVEEWQAFANFMGVE